MNIQPCCDWRAKSFAQVLSTHPREGRGGYWLCQDCAVKDRPHVFDPEKIPDQDRNLLCNGAIAEQAAHAICDYTRICNPDEFNVADFITDIGHFCDREGHDFRGLVRRALAHWEVER